ncbi:MAG: Vi polysaccharide biosynthesis protein VipB/TviC [candidate division NC10 bacterium RIFCSPLOWO2_12_FULL_66_18]|nr:MAG: Vi polysaccharide biosynthesis protein VipB/TviC [candidate division NC10 bacterium RIFCSPLOWO2_12_FULL_66_18]
MPRCLITGGAGFIGANLAHALVARGESVRILDDFSMGRLQNLRGIEDRVEILQGDIRDPAAVAAAVRGVEIILHQAALNSNPRSIKEPGPTNAVNVGGTLLLLEAARAAGTRRVVYASSSSVYGDTPVLPKTEALPLSPKAPYGVSKLAAEFYCRVFSQVYGLETVCLRYFNVFGPRQHPDSEYAAAIPRFLRRMLAGDRPIIFGDGEQSRDFTAVENVVVANLLAAEAVRGIGEVFNIAGGRPSTLNQLVAWLNQLLGTNLPPIYAPPRAADIRHSYASIRKAEEVLGYRPTLEVQEGLRRTVEWFKAHEC